MHWPWLFFCTLYVGEYIDIKDWLLKGTVQPQMNTGLYEVRTTHISKDIAQNYIITMTKAWYGTRQFTTQLALKCHDLKQLHRNVNNSQTTALQIDRYTKYIQRGSSKTMAEFTLARLAKNRPALLMTSQTVSYMGGRKTGCLFMTSRMATLKENELGKKLIWN